MNSHAFYNRKLIDVIVLNLLILYAFLPQIDFNIFGVFPFFVTLIGIVIISQIYFSKSEQFPLFSNYFFIPFAISISISMLNAPRFDEFIFNALCFSLMWIGIPYIGRWLCKIGFERILIDRLLFFQFIYMLYVFMTYDSNSLATRGFIVISTNNIGFTILICSCFLMGFIVRSNFLLNIKVGLALFNVLAGLFINLFMIGSRSSVAGLGISFLLLMFIKYKITLKSILTSIISISLLVMITLTVFEQINVDDNVQNKWTKTFSIENNASIALRLSFLLKSWEMLKDFPFIGGGWNNFRYHNYFSFIDILYIDPIEGETTRPIGVDYKNPHSNFIRVTGELGLFGLICFSSFLIFFFKQLNRIRLYNESYFVNGIFYFIWFPPWLLVSVFHDTFSNLTILLFAILYAFLFKEKYYIKI